MKIVGITVDGKEKNLSVNFNNYIVNAQEFKVCVNKNIISK